ncbi:uncharacterized protein LOC134539695 [Bacillus rossius redtenbacheri]|uniref:uncharacterized protein LOC134539695 n=1 Tax=Bacillus rossius redtenbacheri TaxID=93214 RepID=UPI002FDE18A5
MLKVASVLLTMAQLVVSAVNTLLGGSDLLEHEDHGPPHEDHGQYLLPVLLAGTEGQTGGLDLVHLLPELLLHKVAKVGVWAVGLVLVALVGTAFSAALCSFTSLCSLKFPALDHLKPEARGMLAELASRVAGALEEYGTRGTRQERSVSSDTSF